jgi:hypothetical protein
MAATKKTQTTTLTPEQKKAARAEKERERRENIKLAKAALERAGMDPEMKLDADQRERAVYAEEKKKGLRGKALMAFILDGKTVDDQVKDAQVKTAAQKASAKAAKNVTRASDPDATKLAQDAKALAPDVKSAFLPKDARCFLDEFKASAKGQNVTVVRTTGEKAERVFVRDHLRAFGVDGPTGIEAELSKAIRADLAALGRDTRLWGRKLALMILASV